MLKQNDRVMVTLKKPVSNSKDLFRMLSNDERTLLVKEPNKLEICLSITKKVTWEFIFSLNYNIYKGVVLNILTKEGYKHISSSKEFVEICCKLIDVGVLPKTIKLDFNDKAYISKIRFLSMLGYSDLYVDVVAPESITWDFIFLINYGVHKGIKTFIILKYPNCNIRTDYIPVHTSEQLTNVCTSFIKSGKLEDYLVLDKSDNAFLPKKIFLDMFPYHLEPTGRYLYLLDDGETWVAYEPIDSARGGINGYIATKPQMKKVRDVVNYKIIYTRNNQTYTFKDNGVLQFAKKYFDGYESLEWEDVHYSRYLEAKELHKYITETLIDEPELFLSMINCYSIEAWKECLMFIDIMFGEYDSYEIISPMRKILNSKFISGEDTLFRNEDFRTINLDRFDYDGDEEIDYFEFEEEYEEFEIEIDDDEDE